MDRPIRVLLVDDHDLAREGLRRMLALEPDIEVVGEAANAEEAYSKATATSPDIVLMDIKMPGTNGLEATRQFKSRGLRGEVVILSLYDEHLAQAIEAGAAGYLVKDLKREELVNAIRRVHKGETVLGRSLVQTPHITEAALSHLRRLMGGKAQDMASPQHIPAAPAAGPSPGVLPPVPASSLQEAPPPPQTPPTLPSSSAGYQKVKPSAEPAPPRAAEPPYRSNGEKEARLALPSQPGRPAPEEASPRKPGVEPPEAVGGIAPEVEAYLVISPPIEACHLLGFYRRLQQVAHAEIKQTVGSLEEGTSLKVILRKPVPLLEVLREMPEVALALEEPAPQEVADFSPQDGAQPSAEKVTGKRVRLTLKAPWAPKQLALGLDEPGYPGELPRIAEQQMRA